MDAQTTIMSVIKDPSFGRFGRFLFPTAYGKVYSMRTVGDIGPLLPYHSHIRTDTTVDVINSMKDAVGKGEMIFYEIYTEEEKRRDPRKDDTGLFFFRGEPGAPFAVICAGGGFSYVGSIHESLPYALELSRKGYHGFALQYRTGGAEVACEDLAAAISFIFEHAEVLGVSTASYSLWGGSAGARMAAYLGSYGPAAFGGDDLPRPAAVIMQYTGHAEYTRNDPSTFVCVGENDRIADWRTMEQRVRNLSRLGIATEFHKYPGLGHGFGLGIGTSAEGWLDDAVAFWEGQVIGR